MNQQIQNKSQQTKISLESKALSHIQAQSNLKPNSCIIRSIQNWQLKEATNESQNNYYSLSSPQGPQIRIYFLNHSIVRIRICLNSKKQFVEQSYSLIMTAWDDRFDQLLKSQRKKVNALVNVSFQLKETIEEGAYYYFETNELIGKIYVKPYGIQISNKSGKIIYRDLKGRACKRDLQGRVYHYSQIDPSNDCFYGFGQSTGKLNKNGSRVRLAPQDSLGYDAQSTSAMYKHIPFYIKVNKKDKNAIGLFYNNTYECTFDMGSQKNGYWQPYSYYCADGGDIDLFVINGPTIKRVVQRYTDLTGKTALAPLQSLGYLGSTMYYAELQQKCDLAIIDFVKKCKRENVPISNFHLSSGYTVSQNKEMPKRYVFTWNILRFPNPSQFFNSMKQLGVSVSPNIKPGILTTHPSYQQFAQNGCFVVDPQQPEKPYVDRWWGGDGSFIDFTSSKARDIWKNKIKEQLLTKGATSIWNDNNEYNSIDNRGAICAHSYEQGKGNGTVDELKVVQSLLMAQVATQALKQQFKDSRPFVVTRAACAGMQRYASSWSGDNFTSWKTLKANIATVLNMGLSGFANYGCDVGGFWGPAPTSQLFIRWVQHGIFQPRFSIHSCNSDNTVTQPWMFPQWAPLIAKTIRFRYMLLPYLYSLLYFSHIKGRPIVRPLAYEFQDSDFENCCQQTQQFMFGPYILVANVLDPMSELEKQRTQKYQKRNNTKNQVEQNADNFDFMGFPLINFLVPNCVEMNQSQQWNALARATPLLQYAQPHAKLQKFNYNKKNVFAYQNVYLPDGCNWYSWNGRQKYEGGQTLQIKVNLQSIPLFVKDKSIIPLAIKFGKDTKFDIADMNRQKISGLYFKIAYDNEWATSRNIKTSSKQKNFVQFVMYQDDGNSVVNKSSKKQNAEEQISLGKFSRVVQNKLNESIADDASILLTRVNVRYAVRDFHDKQGIKQNPDMLLINISRQGNLIDDNVCIMDTMILEIKSVDKAPIWITLNGNKCKYVLYENEWTRWRQQPVKSQQKLEQSQLFQETDECGCWYYDHEKGAAVLKINRNIVRPQQNNVDKYRNIQICVCKDRMISFAKQYSKTYQKIEEQITEDKIQSTITHGEDDVIEEAEEIQQEGKKQKTKFKKRVLLRQPK